MCSPLTDEQMLCHHWISLREGSLAFPTSFILIMILVLSLSPCSHRYQPVIFDCSINNASDTVPFLCVLWLLTRGSQCASSAMNSSWVSCPQYVYLPKTNLGKGDIHAAQKEGKCPVRLSCRGQHVQRTTPRSAEGVFRSLWSLSDDLRSVTTEN